MQSDSYYKNLHDTFATKFSNDCRDMLNVYYSGVVLIELVTGWKAMNLKQLKDHST